MIDSQDDAWMVQCLEKVVKENRDSLLFVRLDGMAMAFFPPEAEKNLEIIIEDRGGVLPREEHSLLKDYLIKLCSHKLENMISLDEQLLVSDIFYTNEQF